MRPTVVFPHPDSPTRPSVSPRHTVRSNAVDGLHVSDVAIEDQPALDREPDAEIACLEQGAARGRSRGALQARSRPLVGRCRMEASRLLIGPELAKKRAGLRDSLPASSGSAARTGTSSGARACSAARPRSAAALAFDRCRGGARSAGARMCTGWRGVAKIGLASAGLDDRARVHDLDALAHPGHDAEVVRDQDQRRAALVHEVAQEVEDLCLDRDVERRRRLVGDRAPSARRPAPSRSSRAGASRPRTGAGSPWRAASHSGMPTRWRSSTTRSDASCFETSRCASMASRS